MVKMRTNRFFARVRATCISVVYRKGNTQGNWHKLERYAPYAAQELLTDKSPTFFLSWDRLFLRLVMSLDTTCTRQDGYMHGTGLEI